MVEHTTGRPVGARRCLEACGALRGLGGHSTHNCTDWGPSCSHFKPNLSTSKVSSASTLFISSHYSKGSDRMQCRTGQIFEQSRSSEETDRNVDVSTAKVFVAVETSTFLSVSSLLRDCSKNLPSPTYAVAMSLYQIRMQCVQFWNGNDRYTQ